MIRFGIVKHIDKYKTGLFIRGHANYAKKGEDIVCAAVSAIGQTAAIGVQRFDAGTDIKQCRSGHIIFTCARKAETEAIISTAAAGIHQIAMQYPQCFAEINADGRG